MRAVPWNTWEPVGVELMDQGLLRVFDTRYYRLEVTQTDPLLIMADGTHAYQISLHAGSITGTVSDDAGNGLSGATITALHVPTGVSRSTTTNSTGAYRFSGLRIGGPYVVELAGSSVYGGERVEQISIGLGEAYKLDLTTRTTEIEEIVV